MTGSPTMTGLLFLSLLCLLSAQSHQLDWLARVVSSTSNHGHIPPVPLDSTHPDVPTVRDSNPGRSDGTPSYPDNLTAEELLESLRSLQEKWARQPGNFSSSQGDASDRRRDKSVGEFINGSSRGDLKSSSDSSDPCAPSLEILLTAFPATSATSILPVSAIIDTLGSSLEAIPDSSCQFARLILHLLTVIRSAEEQVPANSAPDAAIRHLISVGDRQSSIPSKTILEDSWTRVKSTQYPVYQALAQLWLRSWQVEGYFGYEARDGLMGGDDARDTVLHRMLIEALVSRDLDRIGSVGGELVGTSIPAAVVAGYLGMAMASERDKERFVDMAQEVVRAEIRSPDDMMYWMKTHWPIWVMLGML